jgi:hypothetical protein
VRRELSRCDIVIVSLWDFLSLLGDRVMLMPFPSNSMYLPFTLTYPTSDFE